MVNMVARCEPSCDCELFIWGELAIPLIAKEQETYLDYRDTNDKAEGN